MEPKQVEYRQKKEKSEKPSPKDIVPEAFEIDDIGYLVANSMLCLSIVAKFQNSLHSFDELSLETYLQKYAPYAFTNKIMGVLSQTVPGFYDLLMYRNSIENSMVSGIYINAEIDKCTNQINQVIDINMSIIAKYLQDILLIVISYITVDFKICETITWGTQFGNIICKASSKQEFVSAINESLINPEKYRCTKNHEFGDYSCPCHKYLILQFRDITYDLYWLVSMGAYFTDDGKRHRRLFVTEQSSGARLPVRLIIESK